MPTKLNNDKKTNHGHIMVHYRMGHHHARHASRIPLSNQDLTTLKEVGRYCVDHSTFERLVSKK